MYLKPVHIVLKGRPASKKTSARLIHAKGRVIPIPSKAHKAFHTQALADLEWLKAYNRLSIITLPVRVDYEFRIKGNYNQDTANAKQTIDDILQDAGIIENDSLICEGSYKRIRGCLEWETVITITPLELEPRDTTLEV